MSNNRFITTKSNYTIKEPRKEINKSVIYERDYMVTTNLGGFNSSTIPYGDGNFKIITGDVSGGKKRHKNGEWLKKNDCKSNIEEECILWTLDDVKNDETVESSENKIVRKYGNQDFLDFVYYGSCVELLKTSINNIILKYPGELYFSNQPLVITTKSGEKMLGSLNFDNPIVVENPFNIDVISETVDYKTKNSRDYNPLRYFSESLNEYVLLNPDDEIIDCLVGWNVNTKTGKNCYIDGEMVATIDFYFSKNIFSEDDCFTDDNQNDTIKNDENTVITIYAYYFNGSIVLIGDGKFYGFKLRPKQSVINKIFAEDFSHFEHFLLNRSSTPIYTIKIKTPIETDKGITYSKQTYTWPVDNKWNLDIKSPKYTKYVSSLISIASFYDENRVDNLWRNMIHDSIKNLDISMNTMTKTDEDSSDYVIGTGNIRGLMLAYGRQFDELKLAIENIKTTNNITYDENNNLPDYFLSDSLNLSGWEVTSVIDTLDKTTRFDSVFSGENKVYDANTLNTHFLRILKINSKHIFNTKGTRNGIEMLLSLFGLCSYDFGKNYYESLPEIALTSKSKNEKSGVNQFKKSKINVNGKVLKWNDLKDSVKSEFYDYKLNEYVVVAKDKNGVLMVDEDELLPVERFNLYKTYANGEFYNSSVAGLPVKVVTVAVVENVDLYGDGTTIVEEIVNKKYLIPWFTKNETYDGNPYFQMFGGWCKDENGDYEETKQYLKVVSTVRDVLSITHDNLREGEIVYVDDISNIQNFISGITVNNTSNYFILNNINHSNIFTDKENGDGWYNIPQSDIDNEIKLGIQVLKLENIIDTSIGNNPHTGYGKYDSGEEYLNYFRQIFKGAIETGDFTDEAYDCETGEINPEIKKSGFDLTEQVDNMKCWYFTDTTNTEKVYQIFTKKVNAEDNYGNEYNDLPFGYEDATFTTSVNVGKKAYTSNKEVFFETNLETYNFENGDIGNSDEASANSIINVKKITIEFNKEKYANNSDFKQFLHNAILPYLKQMIPSTTIMEIIDIDSGVYTTDC